MTEIKRTRRTDNTMTKIKRTSFGHCVVCTSCPFYFGHCVVCPSCPFYFGRCVVCPSCPFYCLSDVHNLISFKLKGYVPKLKKDFILYRSFKDFNHEFFLNDLQSVNFENQIADDDVNRAYSKFETSFIEIIDKHIPIKKRKSVAYPVPYMNQNLRNAIYKKKMYNNKFLQSYHFHIKLCCYLISYLYLIRRA
jgi:ribosomal protein L32